MLTLLHYKLPYIITEEEGEQYKKVDCIVNGLEKLHLQIFEMSTESGRNRLADCIWTTGAAHLNNASAAHAYLVDD